MGQMMSKHTHRSVLTQNSVCFAYEFTTLNGIHIDRWARGVSWFLWFFLENNENKT